MQGSDSKQKHKLFGELKEELRDAKENITAYIKEQENESYSLIQMLNNAPWVSEMTRIIQDAIRTQTSAAQNLVLISNSVPLNVNSRYAGFEEKVKETEQVLSNSGKSQNGKVC